MFETWVQNIKTKEVWKLDTDSTKEVYIDENGQTHFDLEMISQYRFYPICPKDAPTMEVPEYGEQMTLEDFIDG